MILMLKLKIAFICLPITGHTSQMDVRYWLQLITMHVNIGCIKNRISFRLHFIER